ncbi:MAG TPA: universal stress protein [Eudoraea sp.]|nr:universal stress protein [Eudoraea sp.]
MKNVLLPTDFSENSWNAIVYAIQLFKGDACVFHLLNTYTPAIVHSRFMAVSTEGRLLEDAVHMDSENELKRLLKRISGLNGNPNHSFKTISSFSLLTEEIKQSAERLGIDLIITGTKGASGLKEVFLGSNTVRIIKAIRSCPVLAIPASYPFKKPGEIALVTDFKRNYDAAMIEPLRQIAQHLDAAVRIMHINEEKHLNKYQSSNLDILKEYLSDVATSVHWMPYFAGKAKVIKEFSEEFEIDMLAMVNYKHSFLEEVTREAVIKKVGFHTQIPLLTLPE